LNEAAPSNIKILDCACGTGNSYIAFTKLGYDIWGSDGSAEMLRRAAENCRTAGVAIDKLAPHPILWTDWETYTKYYQPASFDLILINGNSFCHIPPVPEYMHVSLRNFYGLLKSGGHLLVDTKKYVQGIPVDGVPMFLELRYVDADNDWAFRTDRYDT